MKTFKFTADHIGAEFDKAVSAIQNVNAVRINGTKEFRIDVVSSIFANQDSMEANKQSVGSTAKSFTVKEADVAPMFALAEKLMAGEEKEPKK